MSGVRLPQAWSATNTTEGGCDSAAGGEISAIQLSTDWRRVSGVMFPIRYVKDPWSLDDF